MQQCPQLTPIRLIILLVFPAVSGNIVRLDVGINATNHYNIFTPNGAIITTTPVNNNKSCLNCTGDTDQRTLLHQVGDTSFCKTSDNSPCSIGLRFNNDCMKVDVHETSFFIGCGKGENICVNGTSQRQNVTGSSYIRAMINRQRTTYICDCSARLTNDDCQTYYASQASSVLMTSVTLSPSTQTEDLSKVQSISSPTLQTLIPISSAPTTNNRTDDPGSPKSGIDKNTGIYIGAAVGSVLLLVVIGIIVCVVLRKRRDATSKRRCSSKEPQPTQSIQSHDYQYADGNRNYEAIDLDANTGEEVVRCLSTTSVDYDTAWHQPNTTTQKTQPNPSELYTEVKKPHRPDRNNARGYNNANNPRLEPFTHHAGANSLERGGEMQEETSADIIIPQLELTENEIYGS